ncbi:MAG: hypothetical protein K1W24_01325 [Lachnospiraceae bacterium]
MKFKSILFADTDIETEKMPPAFFKDLQLDYILNIINHMAGDYQINQYYYTMPGNIPLIQYRQQVFCDLMDKGLCQAVYAFCAGMRKSRHSYMLSLECGEKVRQAGYHLEAALFYWETLDKFRQELNNLSPASYGIRLLKEYVLKHVKDCQESGFSSAAAGAREIFSKMRFYMSVNKSGIAITGVKDTGTEDTEEIPVKKNYLKELSVLLQAGVTDSKTYLNDIFPNVLEPSYLETALIKLLKRSQPEVFVKIQEFYKNYPGFYSEKLLRFEEEVQFYLAFLNFMDKAGTHGCTLNIPEVSNNCRFSGSGVYDIALVFKSAGREQKVVPNDFSFNKEPSFFVVTGPNQGGKTTFARSLGQAAYFSGMMAFYSHFTEEMAFYKGVVNFMKRMEELDITLVMPQPQPSGVKNTDLKNLYELTMAIYMQKKPVGNDLSLKDNTLLLITGANQGGKSTFLRSYGIAQILMQCGMPVPADSFTTPLYGQVFTHFTRREDEQLNSGRLKAELKRMGEMVQAAEPHSLFLLNESFASTTEKEGSQIADGILHAFYDMGITTIMVTHLFQLARSLYNKKIKGMAFLVAERKDDRTRTFKMVPGEPGYTSYGTDLFKALEEEII